MTYKKNINITPVILSGGSGTRLWPLSRLGFPKQFHKFSSDLSLFQLSIKRLNFINKFITSNEIIVVANEEHRFIVMDQLKDVGKTASLILENSGRNTAPALTIAALLSIKSFGDSVLIVLPSDQIIENNAIFKKIIDKAIKIANEGSIVTLGVEPNKPETGFGYIKASFNKGKYGESEVHDFIEKPDKQLAKELLISRQYLWNSGIFILKASVWLNAILHFNNQIFNLCNSAFNKCTFDNKFIRPNEEIFNRIQNISIDKAVIEKCTNDKNFKLVTLPLNSNWSDLGSWQALLEFKKQDIKENKSFGDVISISSENTLTYSTGRLVVSLGVKNLAIVETDDAVMVADISYSQEINSILNVLKKKKRFEINSHRKVIRPWGWYDSIDSGDNFKVKRIRVNPNSSLSLQKHRYRAEHWVVVSGKAKVKCGDKTIILKKNESTYIPQGSIHMLSNPFKNYLEIIEVQTGKILSEDDIIRISDQYGR